MKKILFALALLLGSMSLSTPNVMAQASKEYLKQHKIDRKAAENIAKKQAKLLKKDKWEYTGVVPLEIALTNYYMKTLEECGGEFSGQEHEVNGVKSSSIGEKMLLLNAQALYAQEIQTMLGADLAQSTNAGAGNDFDAYVARVAAKTKHEFYGDIKREILLKKRDPDGKTWSFRGYFVIDKNASMARARQIANQIDRNNDIIDSIHESVLGE